MISSQECVEHITKMQPTSLKPKDRPRVQAAKKIHDTNDMVTKKDTGEIPKEDISVHKKVR